MTLNPLAKRRILVVDDEEGIRFVLQRLLSRLPQPPPLEVATAPSAEDALVMLEHEKFALILSDFNMGGTDGVSLLVTAKERWPETLRILMTGYVDDRIYQDAHDKAGVVAFVRKPWSSPDLLQMLKKLLEAEGTPVKA